MDSFGSRSLFFGGTVLLDVAKEFLQKEKELAAAKIVAAVVDIRYHEGLF